MASAKRTRYHATTAFTTRYHLQVPMTPTLERIAVHPVKSLDPETRERVRLVDRGALAGDREYAMVAAPADRPHDRESASVTGDGDYVNGKRTAAVHRLRSSF